MSERRETWASASLCCHVTSAGLELDRLRAAFSGAGKQVASLRPAAWSCAMAVVELVVVLLQVDAAWERV